MADKSLRLHYALCPPCRLSMSLFVDDDHDVLVVICCLLM